MKIPKKVVLGLTAMLASAMVLTACGGGSSEESGLVLVTAAQPQSFSYETSATGYESAEFFMNTGATLIRNPTSRRQRDGSPPAAVQVRARAGQEL